MKNVLKLAVLCAMFLGIFLAGNGGRHADAAALPVPTTFAQACNGGGFFGLEPWYHFMPDELGMPARGDVPADPCAVRCFNIFPQAQPNACGQKASDIPGVILVIIDDLLRIAGLVAVAFVFKGAFEYVGSRGNSERTAAAQSTIISALTGLAIAIVAVGLITYVGNKLG